MVIRRDAFQFFALEVLVRASPEGCQKVAGGRGVSHQRDDDTPGKRGLVYDLGELAEILASLRDADSLVRCDRGVSLPCMCLASPAA